MYVYIYMSVPSLRIADRPLFRRIVCRTVCRHTLNSLGFMFASLFSAAPFRRRPISIGWQNASHRSPGRTGAHLGHTHAGRDPHEGVSQLAQAVDHGRQVGPRVGNNGALPFFWRIVHTAVCTHTRLSFWHPRSEREIDFQAALCLES